MPLYYFHVQDGISVPDMEGMEIETLAQVKCEAVKLAGRIFCVAAADFWERAEWSMTVTDNTGLTVCALHFLGIEAPVSQMQGRPSPASA